MLRLWASINPLSSFSLQLEFRYRIESEPQEGDPMRAMRHRRVLFLVLLCPCFPTAGAQNQNNVSIRIDANKVENAISPMLYGQFAEFMFQDIKGGLYAELIRDRGFDETPDAMGLPRYWERDPDDRNDDGAMHFAWDDAVYSPV